MPYSDADNALYTIFRELAAEFSGRPEDATEWTEISLSKLGQRIKDRNLPNRRNRTLRAYVTAECKNVATVRARQVVLLDHVKAEIADSLARSSAGSATTIAPATSTATSSPQKDEIRDHQATYRSPPAASDVTDRSRDHAALKHQLMDDPPLTTGLRTLKTLGSDKVEDHEAILCLIVSRWATFPSGDLVDIRDINDLIGKLNNFDSKNVALALAHAIRYANLHNVQLDQDLLKGIHKISQKLDSDLQKLLNAFSSHQSRERRSSSRRSARRSRGERIYHERDNKINNIIEEISFRWTSLDIATTDFLREDDLQSTPDRCVSLNKAASAYSEIALPEETRLIRRNFLGTANSFLSAFRRFCLAGKRKDANLTAEHEQLRAALSTFDLNIKDQEHPLSTLLCRMRGHIKPFEDDLSRGGIAAMTGPKIEVTDDDDIRVDLESKLIWFLIRVRNRGIGRASDISTKLGRASSFSLSGVDVAPDVGNFDPDTTTIGQFNLGPGEESVVAIVLRTQGRVDDGTRVTFIWGAGTDTGVRVISEGTVTLVQQPPVPDWSSMELRPPYTPAIPIYDPARLHGREAVVTELCQSAITLSPMFISGQRRVGKTSILNVVHHNLAGRGFVVAFLQRGEIQGQSQGTIAHQVATQLNSGLGLSPAAVPSRADFGAYLGDRLTGFVRDLKGKNPTTRFLIIFDEFEQVNEELFVGDNAVRFSAGIRGLNQLGVTFFFAGGERLRSVHSILGDFNTWHILNVERIESPTDLRALISKPVDGAIAFSEEAIVKIQDYCKGNPYYTTLLCQRTYRLWSLRNRTYVSGNDIHSVIDGWLSDELNDVHFSHFWDDEPALDRRERRRHQAESAFVIACVSVIGGSYEHETDVEEGQQRFGLVGHQYLGAGPMHEVLSRLIDRDVLELSGGGRVSFVLDVFRDWLARPENRRKLVDRWRRFCDEEKRRRELTDGGDGFEVKHVTLPVGDHEILDLLDLLDGSGIDIEKMRTWLGQFVDKESILDAWRLVRRMAEKGYVGPGHQDVLVKAMEQGLTERRRGIDGVANGIWRYSESRGNPCIDPIVA